MLSKKEEVSAGVWFRLYCVEIREELLEMRGKDTPTPAERAEAVKALRAQVARVHKDCCLEAEPEARPDIQRDLIGLVLATLV